MPEPAHLLPGIQDAHPRSQRAPWLGLVLAAAGILLPAPPAVAAPDGVSAVSREYQIKAAFLYNFSKFVDWPPRSFASPASPIVIGILGGNPFGDELEKIVSGRTVNGRSIVVRSVNSPAEVSSVHLLFVPAGEENRLPASAWQDAAVVAVGESEAFAGLGGTITFTHVDDKVRFSINLESAERAGLKISAQLLKLAASVRRKP